ncbi:MAG: VWA-like domain-containing protein [Actinomycetota bacterium]|nr:VWA-like domain-containing protein [Actinomycetota bacterium]
MTTAELPTWLRERWAAARVWAAHQVPYLSAAILALDPVVVRREVGEVADLRRFPVDQEWRIYLDADVLGRLEVSEVGWWVVHQVTHLLRGHADRYPGPSGEMWTPHAGRTPAQQRWNVATDCEIDDDLQGGGLARPADAAAPEQFALPDGLVAETYWDMLAATDDAGDCGGGCDGRPRPWHKPGTGMPQMGRKLARHDVARRIREHLRHRGTVPQGWARWADRVLEPTVDWRRQLATKVRRGVADAAGRVDFTYRRASRRASVTPDVVMPSLRQPTPNVAVVIDTSGSMSDQMLAQALGEVGGVLRSLGITHDRLRVIACDAVAYEAQAVRSLGQVELSGGGGTDMCAGLDAATAIKPAPDVVVVLTDGFTPWPATPPPRTKVVVGLMDPGGSVPDWAEHVLVGDTGVGTR